MNNLSEKVSFIRPVADLLREPYRSNQHKDFTLPMTVLCRLDCVLEPTENKVVENQKKLYGGKIKNVDSILCHGRDIEHIAFGNSYNDDRFLHNTFDRMLTDPPLSVEWKVEADFIARAHEEQGFGGRFGAGLSKTIGWKPLSHCRTNSSIIPASAPTSRSSPTARNRAVREKFNWRMAPPSSRRCANRSATDKWHEICDDHRD